MSADQKVAAIARLIRDATHAIALTGAGISTPSGIPDFRSPGSGLWEQADPMSVASIWGFLAHPDEFYRWVQPLTRLIQSAKPNPAHCALAELEALGRIHAVITQNIDNLHQEAGSQHVLEVHGHLREATCVRCYHLAPGRPILANFLREGTVPLCSKCGGAMKPNVVLFGEMLPVSVMYAAEQQAKSCDLMIVVGSSLEVAPAADLPLLAKRHAAQVVIVNKLPTIADGHAAIVLREDVAVALPKIAAAVRAAL